MQRFFRAATVLSIALSGIFAMSHLSQAQYITSFEQSTYTSGQLVGQDSWGRRHGSESSNTSGIGFRTYERRTQRCIFGA